MTRPPGHSLRRRHALTAIGLALLAWAAPASAQTTSAHLREVRGTWISTSNLSASGISTAAGTTTNFRRLRNVGLNSIYVDAFRNGASYFNSPSLVAAGGSSTPLGTRDLLAETVLQARRNQMAPFAWFQYGFMASFEGSTPENPTSTNGTNLGSALATQAWRNGWLLQDPSGNVNSSSQGFAWMNPAVPAVRQLLVNMSLEVVRSYNVAGIQFDDHTAWPAGFGYDATTRSLFTAETGASLPATGLATGSTLTTFNTWRSGKVRLFFEELQTAVRAVRPDIILSVSPSTMPTANSSFLANWPDWVNAGLLDEYVPQVYRSGYTNFARDWSGTGSQTQYFTPSGRMGDAVAGMAIDTSNTTVTDVTQSITLVRNTPGAAGHSIWYANGIYLNEATFTSFYNVAGVGQAVRPDLGALPAPIVATSLGSNQWRIVIPESLGMEGRFDLIAGLSNTWRTEQSGLILTPGTYTFTVASADQVELMATTRIFVVPEPRMATVLPLFALATRRPRRRACD